MIRGKTDVTRLLVFLLAFEVLYFFVVGFMWTVAGLRNEHREPPPALQMVD